MDITVYNYLNQSLADDIAAKAAERATAERLAAETAQNTTADAVSEENGNDFATVLRRIANGEITASGEEGTATKLYSTAEMEPMFEEASQTYNISSDLLKAVAKTESAFTASAVSSAGAVGVMQLMPSTAAYLGVTDSYDAYQNIMGGAKYLRELMDKYDGSVTLALAAYNGGSNNVDTYGGVPPFTETQNYVKKVLSYLAESSSATTSAKASAESLLSGTRTQVNSALEAYFTSKNITKESLDSLTELLRAKESTTETNQEQGISEEAASIVLSDASDAAIL